MKLFIPLDTGWLKTRMQRGRDESGRNENHKNRGNMNERCVDFGPRLTGTLSFLCLFFSQRVSAGCTVVQMFCLYVFLAYKNSHVPLML